MLFVVPAALFFATAGIVLYESPTTCPQVVTAGQKSSSESCVKVDITIQDDVYTAATYKPAAAAIAGGVYLLYLVVVQWIVQAMTGATLGKAIFGIRTVDEQGQPPGLGKQFIRGLLWIIDSLCNALVAAILILATKGHRRLGDMAAKTFVVHTSAKGSPVVVPGLRDRGRRRRRGRHRADGRLRHARSDEPRRALRATDRGGDGDRPDHGHTRGDLLHLPPRPRDRSGTRRATRTCSGIRRGTAGSPTTTPPRSGSRSRATSPRRRPS